MKDWTLTPHAIELQMAPGYIKKWRPLLWRGFTLEVMVGGSLEELLVNQLKIEKQVLEKKIKTLFLNGRPVDDMAAAIVEQDSQIALGGAMPGMVGIAMRRQSPIAHLRHGITCQAPKIIVKRKTATVTVKLFHEIAELIGPMFLTRGCGVEADLLDALLADPTGIRTARIDGQPIAPQALRSQLAQGRKNPALPVHFRVCQ